MSVRLLGILVLAACAGWAGCTPATAPPPDEQANPFYRSAKERVEARDFAGAVEAFEKALQLDPNAVMAHFELGLVLEQHQFDYAGAIHHYNKVLKLRPAGYPADIARVRIRVCKQELAKSLAMESLVPSLPLQFEKLREENERLLRLLATQKVEIATLQTQLLAARAALAAPPNPTARTAAAPPSSPALAARRGEGDAGRGGGAPAGTPLRETPTRAAPRLHQVRPGETLSAIARRYGVRLEALQAANPGVNPQRLRPGQSLAIPSS